MKKLLYLALSLLLALPTFAQTDVDQAERDTTYLLGDLNGQSKLFKASEFLGGSGAADGLGQPHQATASLNMDGNEIDSISILTLEDADADTDTWSILEKATTGDLWIQSSESGTADVRVETDGTVHFGGSAWPSAPGANGTVPTSDGVGGVSWQTPSGGGGGSTLYYFGGVSTQTDTLAQDTWVDLAWAVELKKDASFTHSTVTDNEQITLDSAGLYVISFNVQFDVGGTREDGNLRVQRDIGGGWVDLPYGMGYVSFGGETFNGTTIQTRGLSGSDIMYDASAGDKIKVQGYIDGDATWAFVSGSHITVTRIE